MKPIQPIEPAQPAYGTRRVERRLGDAGGDQQPHGEAQERSDEETPEDDGLPHIDVRG